MFRVPHFTQRCDHLQNRKKCKESQKSFFYLLNLFELPQLFWSQFCIFFVHSKNLQYIDFNACPFVYMAYCTFPTMHLLQAAQWPLAVVRTPIFSKSELSPPSSSSIVSVFLLVVEAFASEPAVLLLLPLSLFSCCPPSVFLFTDCFCESGGGVVEDTGS